MDTQAAEPTDPSPSAVEPGPGPGQGADGPGLGLAPLDGTDNLDPLRRLLANQVRTMLSGLLANLDDDPDPRVLHLVEAFAGFYREMAAALTTRGDSLFRRRSRRGIPIMASMMQNPAFDDDGGSPSSETFAASTLTQLLGSVGGANQAKTIADLTAALAAAKQAGLPEAQAIQVKLQAALDGSPSGPPVGGPGGLFGAGLPGILAPLGGNGLGSVLAP